MSDATATNAERGLSLTKRRVIAAAPDRVFAAWTDPTLLKAWWGPTGVSCPDAEIDLRVGGHYRIANRFPDGRIVWIVGRFVAIEPPHRLSYTWMLEPTETPEPREERVTVSFNRCGAGTEVTVQHERIESALLRDKHAAGWDGCLEGLAACLGRV